MQPQPPEASCHSSNTPLSVPTIHLGLDNQEGALIGYVSKSAQNFASLPAGVSQFSWMQYADKGTTKN